MVELLIGGKRVNLSADTSFDFYDRNPLFSKEGQHTLDIDIDLGDPVNANVYRNLYRIDAVQRPAKRSAVLYNERGVIIRGTEVILEVTERVAKIQLVSGNSELNYLSGGDSKLRDLDLGEINGLNATIAWNSLSGSYPEWDYVCAPVCTRVTFAKDVMPVVDIHGEREMMNELSRSGQNTISLKSGTTLCPQPYLAAMVRKVIEALGYSVTGSFIERDAALKKVILVNGYHSTKFNEMLPNWSVNDFLSEVENFTGCIIVVNQLEKTVEIIQARDFYEDAETEVVDGGDVIGDAQKMYDEESPEGVLYHNISYKFPNTEIYKYWSVERDFMNSLTVEQCADLGARVTDPRYYRFLIDIWTVLNGGTVPEVNYDWMFTVPDAVKEQYNKMIAYKDLGTDYDTCFVLRSVECGSTWCVAHLRRLNYYGARYDDRTDDSMDLKIVPAEVVWHVDYNDLQLWEQPYLLARNADSATTVVSDDEEEKGLNDYIGEGQEAENTGEVLYAAFYLGFKDNNFSQTKAYQILSPTAVPSNEVERFFTWVDLVHMGWSWWQRMEMVSYGEPGCCMAINGEHGMYERYWKNNLRVNFTQPWKIRFRNAVSRDSRNLFVIANKKFYCQELKYKVTGGRMSEVVEGTFFPVLGESEVPVAGEDIAIQVRVVTVESCATFLSDKRLDFPITLELRGDAVNVMYVKMPAGTTSVRVGNEWIRQCSVFTASLYSHEEDDENEYTVTVSAEVRETIDIAVTLSGTSVTAVAASAVDSVVVVVLRVWWNEVSEYVTVTIGSGETRGTGTSTGQLDDRTSAEGTAYATGSDDDTYYRVVID